MATDSKGQPVVLQHQSIYAQRKAAQQAQAAAATTAATVPAPASLITSRPASRVLEETRYGDDETDTGERDGDEGEEDDVADEEDVEDGEQFDGYPSIAARRQDEMDFNAYMEQMRAAQQAREHTSTTDTKRDGPPKA